MLVIIIVKCVLDLFNLIFYYLFNLLDLHIWLFLCTFCSIHYLSISFVMYLLPFCLNWRITNYLIILFVNSLLLYLLFVNVIWVATRGILAYTLIYLLVVLVNYCLVDYIYFFYFFLIVVRCIGCNIFINHFFVLLYNFFIFLNLLIIVIIVSLVNRITCCYSFTFCCNYWHTCINRRLLLIIVSAFCSCNLFIRVDLFRVKLICISYWVLIRNYFRIVIHHVCVVIAGTSSITLCVTITLSTIDCIIFIFCVIIFINFLILLIAYVIYFSLYWFTSIYFVRFHFMVKIVNIFLI